MSFLAHWMAPAPMQKTPSPSVRPSTKFCAPTSPKIGT